jgi:hypothetical protein
MSILMDRTIKLLAVVSKNETLAKEYAKENLDLWLDTDNHIPYLQYGDLIHLYDQMDKDEYTKWKNRVRHHFKKEGIICPSNMHCNYTLKEFVK